MRRAGVWISMLVTTATVAGCSAPHVVQEAALPAHLNTLVLPGHLRPYGQGRWVEARNDAGLGAYREARQPYVDVTETMVREQLWISNGRPRENSRWTTYTYRRR